jgi:UDP-N-acetyl-2-amino-2-deoxyglucuronate dehydrogenase
MTRPDAPTRALIIGCGIIGKHHGIVLTRHPDFEVTALVDPVVASAEAVADTVVEEGAERPVIYGSIADALSSGTVDLAVICTPSGLHIQQATECLEHDVHLVVEKPLDVSVALGTRFAELAAKAAERGLMVSVISQHRFDPGATVIRKAIDEQQFGTLTSAVATMAWYRSQQYYDSGDWRGTWALDGGGAVMNQGVHTVDLLRWFLGRPTEIYAHTAQLAHQRIEIEDTATATVRFESGALAVIHCTTAAYPGLTARVQVHGSHGSAILDNDELRYFHTGDGAVADNLRSAAVTGNQAADVLGASDADEYANSRNQPDGFVLGHLRQYDDIAGALKDKRSPLVDVNEALLSLALVRSLYVSATLGQPVLFDDVLNGRYDDVVATVTQAPAQTAAEVAK